MVEHHVEHQADAALIGLCDELFHIFHRSISRVDVIIIRHVIPIVILRRYKEWSKPDIIDTEFFYIIKFAYNSAQIAKSVFIRVTE